MDENQTPLLANQQEYKPPTVNDEEGPHFRLTTAVDTDPERPLNGGFRFKYPNAFTQTQIGSRTAEIVNYGRRFPINLDQMPYSARLRAEAIATLEYVIVTAPAGWYMDGDKNQPALAPGMVGGDGNDEAVLEVWEGYLAWRTRFREALDAARKSKKA